MTVYRPSVEHLLEISEGLGMRLSAQDAAEYLALMQANFDAYDFIDAQADEIPEVRYPRTPGYRPGPGENPHNAWYYKARVEGAAEGRLAGRTVALKDNVSLAGVPMMNGSSTLEGHIPGYDATIVTRMLDEGAVILGKATCEHFCLSGSSHTSDPAPVHHPFREGYSSGGSSSGSAVLVALAEVDLAIGCDQGGSIRIPSAFSGTYGMKPTHGLVPYTGIMPIEATIDHTGPITANVRDNALLLEVIAGPDGLDPRQGTAEPVAYTQHLERGVEGLKIGVLSEGFALANMDPRVADTVRKAAGRFASLGAKVEEVSIPEHATGPALWIPIGCEGLQAQMMLGNGMGFNWKGLYDVALLDAHSAWRSKADDLSPTLKICMFVGQYGISQYGGRFYAKTQNLVRRLKAAYDANFAKYDLLLLPTVPVVAQPFPAAGASLAEYIGHGFEMIANTAPFNLTGHPAMSVPCGLVDGLPVGLMLVGPSLGEASIYQAAAGFEASGDWKMF